MKQIILYSLVCIASLNTPLSGQTKVTPKKTVSPSADVLTNQSIISLVKAGLDKTIIITTIKNAESSFDVSATALTSLKKQGVHNDVITAMVDKSSYTEKPAPAKKGSATLTILNHPHYFDVASNSYKALDKVNATMKTKMKALGYGGTQVIYEITGEKSSLRISNGQDVAFIINTGSNPLPELTLFKLNVKAGNRSIATFSVNALGKSKGAESVIQFNASAVKDGVYKLEISQKLEAGEYFFATKPTVSAASIDVFAFGIE